MLGSRTLEAKLHFSRFSFGNENYFNGVLQLLIKLVV